MAERKVTGNWWRVGREWTRKAEWRDRGLTVRSVAIPPRRASRIGWGECGLSGGHVTPTTGADGCAGEPAKGSPQGDTSGAREATSPVAAASAEAGGARREETSCHRQVDAARVERFSGEHHASLDILGLKIGEGLE